MKKKNNVKVHLIYSITFAILFTLLLGFYPEFDLVFGLIGFFGGILLGLLISFVVKMIINNKEEVRKYFGINVKLNEIEILIYLISLVLFDIILSSIIENPYIGDPLGLIIGIIVGMILVKIYRKVKIV